MELDPDAFNAHLAVFAEPFLYRKAFACPCLNPSSGSPTYNCPQCGGKGWLWSAAVNAPAAVASGSVQLKWAKMGNYEDGDCVLSIPNDSPMYHVSQFDRVTALTSSDRRSLSLVHGDASERLVHTVKEIYRVFWLDDASHIVEGGIPAVDPATGRLTWTTGEPPAGKAYSISYERLLDYYCFGAFSADRRKHGGVFLPNKVVLRRFDLLGRTPSTGEA